MKLEPGQRLLHYELAEKIGEGGMGVVWKARDTTLERDVAIKVLPEGFSGDPDRLARFEREARLLASLNHPHIAGIYGIHTVDKHLFLAMELVDGEDLAQRLSRGALHRKEALRIGLQIAQAFEAAHESGVIHRDLKPANVKLTAAGQVKVLDFGLAKALSTEASGPGASASLSPTLTSTGTLAGTLIGTAAYMSPEQAKGKPVDRRADIWSFGVLLHEMLAGRRLFEGEGISETLAAVIMKDIELESLPGDTPRGIRRLLERCLQRDPNQRLRDIGDARIRIEEALAAPEAAREKPVAAPRRGVLLAWLPWAVAALAVLGLAWVVLKGEPAAGPGPVMRFALGLADDQPLANRAVPMLAISPDGTRIAYIGRSNNTKMLFLRLAHQTEAAPLRGTEDADNPFFSPDGDWIGFNADGKLKKISVLGGPPTTLCNAPNVRGADWGDDGTIVFAPSRAGGLARVSEAGGAAEPLTGEEGFDSSIGQPSDRWPQFLPGGRHAIYTSTELNNSYTDAEIRAVSLEDGTVTTLVRGGTFGRYVAPGFLVYARENTLFAARFDPRSLELLGQAVPVLEGVSGAATFGSKQLAFSQDGTLLFLGGGPAFGRETLVWLEPDGTETPASEHEADYGAVRLSPDGRSLALEIIAEADEVPDIWVLELARDTLSRLTFAESIDFDPIWHPDGEWIYFTSVRENHPAPNIYRIRADGTGPAERVLESSGRQVPIDWTPDGSAMTLMQRSGGSGDVMLYRPGAEPEIQPVTASEFAEFGGRLSPDGRWVAYNSNVSGTFEIYVRSIDGEGRQVKVSTSGGNTMGWSADGKALLYRGLDQKLKSVRYHVEDGRFLPDLPVDLFDFPSPPYSFLWDLAPDGRILAYKDLSTTVQRRDPLVVVHWPRELDEKVP